ncbi:type I-E CRISPR-associated protein Cse1/CasA [Kitasatospora acidiphila]|uniref:type I-E CRISPR-associated protein Cse1/CasA n=1 Tax=Kitasatospora acidiphila TaxID=2567942 RepID=UPI003C73E5F7
MPHNAPPSTTAPTYNLLDEPWIPVGWTDSRPDLPENVGLRELLLRSHEIARIAVALPPALSALYRILYALTARITELDEAGPGDWGERRLDVVDRGQLEAGAVERVLGRYRPRFDLFDPQRPFLQDPRLVEQCDSQNTAGVNKLITTRPSGNNHAWFRHVSDTAPDLPTCAEAAMHLLVWHYYGPSGRCSSRRVGTVEEANAKAGPLRSTLSYHPEGENLFETLLAGLPQPASTVRRDHDQCPWEWDQLPDPKAAPPQLRGVCSELTARSQHALLLVPDEAGSGVRDAFITWAYRDKIDRTGDPYLIWQTSKDGNPYPRPADSARALWRDLDALLLKNPSGTAQPRRPTVFETASEVSENLRARALGFEQDGQAKDIQFVDASTPPVLGLREDREPLIASEIGRLRAIGEGYGNRLERAAKKAWFLYTDAEKIADCTWAVDAAARYWPGAETEFWRRLDHKDFEGAAKSFRTLAERVYQDVTASAVGTLRGAKACSQARAELYTQHKPPAKAGKARQNLTVEDV